MKGTVLPALLIIAFIGSASVRSNTIRLPESRASEVSSESDYSFPVGSTPVIDGVLNPNEWTDAAYGFIDVEKGWKVKVFYKRDRSSLYFAFSELKHNGQERYPEIMIDAKGDRGEDDWWIHISYNDCEAKGRYNVWNCTPTKPGWKANNFPLSDPGIVEAEVTYEKLGFAPRVPEKIGLAFNVTDTRNAYHFWPAKARLDNPSSWAMVKLSN